VSFGPFGGFSSPLLGHKCRVITLRVRGSTRSRVPANSQNAVENSLNPRAVSDRLCFLRFDAGKRPAQKKFHGSEIVCLWESAKFREELLARVPGERADPEMV